MRHLTEGVLRRLLDEPAGVADSDRAHVAGCPQCLRGLAAVQADAAVVRAALATADNEDVDVPAAWHRLTSAAPATAATYTAAAPRRARSRAFLRRPVTAALAFAVVLGGAGAAAANGWLEIFRTEQIAPVSFSMADLNALPDLRAYGDVVLSGDPNVHQVSDAEAAAAETGLDIPEVTALPRGVSGDPILQVGSEVAATFTFSAERAAAAAADSGESPPPPPGLDGSQVRLVAGPGVAAVWSSASEIPALLVGRAVAPTAFSTGVPFEALRDYVLSLPGLPADVAAQLRTFNADGGALPLPVPTEEVTTSSTQVNGVPATLLETRDRTLAAVVWVQDGVVTVVAGSLDEDEVLSVARGLG